MDKRLTISTNSLVWCSLEKPFKTNKTMKLIQNFTGKFCGCVTALFLASVLTTVQAQTFKQGNAKVSLIKGKATYSVDDAVWVPLKIGTTLKPGSIVQTAPESIVDLNLGENGPVVRVAPNTKVTLDKLAYSGSGMDSVVDTRVSLQEGTIIGNVKKLAKASKYEIKTPNGVAGIRGTDYAVTVKKRPNTGDTNDPCFGAYEVKFVDVNGTLVVAALVRGKPETVVLNGGESWIPCNDVTPLAQQLLDFYQNQIAQAIASLENPIVPLHPVPPIEIRVSPGIGGHGHGHGHGQIFDKASGN
jgi:hypothetical protein